MPNPLTPEELHANRLWGQGLFAGFAGLPAVARQQSIGWSCGLEALRP